MDYMKTPIRILTNAQEVVTVEHQPTRVLRPAEVARRTGLSIPTLWRMRRDGKFPQPFRLSKGAVAWLEADVERWIADRVAGAASEIG
jgi:prophage regulatory protein